VTVSRPDITLPIDVRGDVCLVGPSGRQVTLRAAGSELLLAVPGWAELKLLGPRSLLAQRRALAATLRALRTLHLTLRVDVGGQPAFGLGHGVRTSWLARLLGLASADIRFAAVAQLLRSRAVAR
jgi:hypothetical protein